MTIRLTGSYCRFLSITFIMMLVHLAAHSQFSDISSRLNSASQSSSSSSSGQSSNNKDSLQHRDRFADSITIFYKYYDSTRTRTIDSSINDFNKRFSFPYTYDNLGNLGTATRSLLFNPILKSGWDAGFHQYDIYNYTIENTRFFQTTRPYSELGYLLGSKNEQTIDVLHTQNRKSNFNFSLEYRFINSPGTFRTQNSSHNNLRFTTHYQSRNKRYESYLIYLSNKNASSENGGLVSNVSLDTLGGALNNPYQLATRLGSPTAYSPNPFNTTVNTGNIYKESKILFRHQYDLGIKDSIVTDSTTIHLFHPRFRIQHTLQLASNEYRFVDNDGDSTKYATYYNYHFAKDTISQDTISFKDHWTHVSNELSFISFPDKNNQSQYLKIGTTIQNLKQTINDKTSNSFYNFSVIGEYRNRTRNKLWDVIANGQLYLNGLNAGDFQTYVSLKRKLSNSLGSFQIGFQNVNRSPSFLLNAPTAFPMQAHGSFAKENITHLFAFYDNEKVGFKLSGDYYLLNNYTYDDNFFHAVQYASLFNVLHINGEKVFKLHNHINYYLEIHLQQATGNAPISVPQFLTRQRIAFEGNFYTNLFLSTGLEVRYVSDYKAPNYSPFIGHFFYQDNTTLSNRPDINFFFHFRIKSFKAFFRLENLNTVNPSDGFSFSHYNYKLSNYANTGLFTRFGIWWNFIN